MCARLVTVLLLLRRGTVDGRSFGRRCDAEAEP